MQYFKGDDTELKFFNTAAPLLDALSLQKTLLHDGAYTAGPLGDAIYNSGRSPLTNAIKQDIFRAAFAEIFGAFEVAGSFESYLTVFRKIFGSSVTVTFTVPNPGQLTIAIVAEGVISSDFVARRIEDNAYVFDTVVDDVSDTITLQTIKGFQSQYELEKMLFEMVPAGVYTQITLTLLGA